MSLRRVPNHMQVEKAMHEASLLPLSHARAQIATTLACNPTTCTTTSTGKQGFSTGHHCEITTKLAYLTAICHEPSFRSLPVPTTCVYWRRVPNAS